MGAIRQTRAGAVLTLELTNPGKANALDLDMLEQLDRHAAQVEGDETIRVVLLRGSKGSTFSSGADIRQWAPMEPECFARQWIEYGNAVFRRFERLRCPTVAAIEGLCFGGGLELALCADLRVGNTEACLRFPEVAIGAIPGWEGGARLERIAGRGRALEAVLTSRVIDALTAERWDILNAVWPRDSFERSLAELLAGLCRVSPKAAAWSKAAIVGGHDPETFYLDAARAIKASTDAAIGIQAFFDKTTATY